MSFVHLHTQSWYSFLDAAASPATLVAAAKAAGMEALALTDTANMCGAVEFHKACKKQGIKPIYGASLWVMPEEATQAQSPVLTLFAPPPTPDKEVTYLNGGFKIVLLVRNVDGWTQLCDLLTHAHQQIHYTPRVRMEQLTAAASSGEGLLLLAGAGLPAELLHAGSLDAQVAELANAFGDRMYLELCDHGAKADDERNLKISALAERTGRKTVWTNSVRYLTPTDAPLLDALRAIGTGYSMSDLPYTTETDQAYLKTADEMSMVIHAEAMARTVEIAKDCNFDLVLGTVCLPGTEPTDEHGDTVQAKWSWLADWLPAPKIFGGVAPPVPTDSSGGLTDPYFAWYARRGLEVRLTESTMPLKYGTRAEYEAQIEYEIGVICQMEYPTYHLMVAEFINWSKDQGIPVGPGRGSAAGSIVCWAMRITDVNPFQFGLMFERFLNPARQSMPDIDVDFSQADRVRVIDHVRERYGSEQVGQILTIGKLKAKAAFGDASRTLRISFSQRNDWSNMLEDIDELGDAERLPEIQEYLRSPVFRHIWSLARMLEGAPRNTGVHAAGVIITDRPLKSFAPVHTDPSDNRVFTGTDMKASEALGMVKFDFLGLKTLDILELACDLIVVAGHERPKLDALPLDDVPTMKLLSAGDGLGLFQVESHGMRHLMRRIKPSHIEHVVALIALYRPGPLSSGMVEQFVEVRHGRAKVSYPHPLLEEVLKPTFGVIVYQEQVMKAAQVLAGYSLADADLLRRAMGKKIKQEMDEHRVLFEEGCERSGVGREDGARIFDLIAGFASYGFNRSHSAAYGLITWQTAYLKTHHRAELMAAAMTFEASKRDKLASYMFDVQASGIRVLAPDINLSKEHFTVERRDVECIRYGLGAVKGLGEAALKALIDERSLRGSFDSLDGLLLSKIKGVGKTVLNALCDAGALDSFEVPRHEVLERIAASRTKKKIAKAPDEPLMLILFGDRLEVVEDPDDARSEPGDAEERFGAASLADDPWSYTTRMQREYKALGFWITGHPLDRWADVEQRIRTATTAESEQLERNDPVSLVGIVSSLHRVETRTGAYMMYLTLADRVGMLEVVLRPVAFSRFERLCKVGAPVQIHGTKSADGPEGRVVVDKVVDLRSLRARIATCIDIYIEWHKVIDPGKPDSRLHQVIEEDDGRLSAGSSFQSALLDLLDAHAGHIPVRLVIIESLGDEISPVGSRAEPLGWIDLSEFPIRPTQSFFDDVEKLTRRPDAARLPGRGVRL